MEENEIKIDKEDIFEINQIQELFNNNAFNIGVIKQKIFISERSLKNLENDYEMILKQNQNVREKIVKKYGEGTIDLDKGIFIKNSK